MERMGYFRKYILFEQLDSGYGVQRTPDGFARLEGYKDGIALSLQVRFLKEGELPYTVILIYDKGDDTGVFRIGTLQTVSTVGSFRRFIDFPTLKTLELAPDKIKYILVASEQEDKVSIPLLGCCRKNEHWDESIRQRLLNREKKPKSGEERKEKADRDEVKKPDNMKDGNKKDDNTKADIEKAAEKETKKEKEDKNAKNPKTSGNRVDEIKLEKSLKETFETMEPFSNPRHDYSWYRVNDIAKLSNILHSCNLTIPLFANPRILVGLFKYRHLLAGFYRSDINHMTYFVLGVPARDETDGKPFENVCRWVPVKNSDFGDMNGYWLSYISLKDGEFVS